MAKLGRNSVMFEVSNGLVSEQRLFFDVRIVNDRDNAHAFGQLQIGKSFR